MTSAWLWVDSFWTYRGGRGRWAPVEFVAESTRGHLLLSVNLEPGRMAPFDFVSNGRMFSQPDWDFLLKSPAALDAAWLYDWPWSDRSWDHRRRVWLGFNRMVPTTAPRGPWEWTEFVPDWFVAALLSVLPARARRRWQRRVHPPGHCRRCGYDLRATPGRCPECGAAAEPAD